MRNIRTTVQKWALRYIKYNIIGVTVFLLNLTFYYIILFPAFGEQAYIIVSVIGGAIEFGLITYLNKTKRGMMFDSCTQIVKSPDEKQVIS